MPEAKLAREAELPYAIVAMVTDFDCWHPDHDHVTVDAVVKVMHANGENARKLIMTVAKNLGPVHNRPNLLMNGAQRLGPVHKPSPHIETVLDTAIMTAPRKRDPRLIRKLDAIAGRILPKKASAKSKKAAPKARAKTRRRK